MNDNSTQIIPPDLQAPEDEHARAEEWANTCEMLARESDAAAASGPHLIRLCSFLVLCWVGFGVSLFLLAGAG